MVPRLYGPYDMDHIAWCIEYVKIPSEVWQPVRKPLTIGYGP